MGLPQRRLPVWIPPDIRIEHRGSWLTSSATRSPFAITSLIVCCSFRIQHNLSLLHALILTHCGPADSNVKTGPLQRPSNDLQFALRANFDEHSNHLTETTLLSHNTQRT